MHTAPTSPTDRFCPDCGKHTALRTTTIFVEYGEWDEDRDSYDEEGDVDVFRCTETLCGSAFADLNGFALEPLTDPDQAPLWNSTSDPSPNITEPKIS